MPTTPPARAVRSHERAPPHPAFFTLPGPFRVGRLVLATTVIASTVSACRQRDPVADRVERVDSAGVEIVRNALVEIPLTLDSTVEYRLGGKENDETESFFTVSRYSVVTDPEGRITILDRSGRRVLVFDSAGRHLRTVGQRGDGPGEMEAPTGLAVTADGEIIIRDMRKPELVAFGADGEPVQSPRLPDGMRPTVLAADGRALVFDESTLGPRPRLVRVEPGGEVSELVSIEPSEMKPITLESCGMSFSGMAPLFAVALRWDVGAGVVAVASRAEYRVDLFRGPRLVRSVRLELPLRRATHELAVREVGEGMRVGTPTGVRVCEPEEVAEERGFADAIPAVGAVRVAPDGGLWVQRYQVGDEPSVIDLFDPDGVYRGTLPEGTEMPVGFLPDGRVLWSETDALDVDRLVVARVDIRP